MIVASPFMFGDDSSLVINACTAWETQKKISVLRGEEFSTNLTPVIND